MKKGTNNGFDLENKRSGNFEKTGEVVGNEVYELKGKLGFKQLLFWYHIKGKRI